MFARCYPGPEYALKGDPVADLNLRVDLSSNRIVTEAYTLRLDGIMAKLSLCAVPTAADTFSWARIRRRSFEILRLLQS